MIKLSISPIVILFAMASILWGAAATEASVTERVITGDDDQSLLVTLERQLTYVLNLYDGHSFLPTFSPQQIGTIYMVAGVDNVITPASTDVYYWPITRQYMGDWSAVNEFVPGSLEIRQGDRQVAAYEPLQYTLYYPNMQAGKATELFVAEAAAEAMAEYRAKVDAFYHNLVAYYQLSAEYDELLRAYVRNPEQFPDGLPPEPRAPSAPREFVMDLQPGFVVNLPAGQYTLQLRDAQGEIIPGSARQVISFPALAQGVTFEIIPADRWTFPIRSDDRTENIFARPDQVVYLNPFAARQYNRYHHAKLGKLQSPLSGRGMENQTTWVKMEALDQPDSTMAMVRHGEIIQTIAYQPYIVVQRPGSALGYDILDYTKEAFPHRNPSFWAFKIAMPAAPGQYELRLVDGHGQEVEGGTRYLYTVEIVDQRRLLAAAAIPLVVGFVVVLGMYLKRRQLTAELMASQRKIPLE